MAEITYGGGFREDEETSEVPERRNKSGRGREETRPGMIENDDEGLTDLWMEVKLPEFRSGTVILPKIKDYS